MTKSATDVMQEIMFSAIVDAIDALKASSQGVPNNLLRVINSVHANTTFADLPRELQSALTGSVRSAFTRLMREGYSIASAQAATPASRYEGRPSGPRGERRAQPPRRGKDNGGRDGPDGRRPPRGGPPNRGRKS